MTVALDFSREGSTHSTYSQSFQFRSCSMEPDFPNNRAGQWIIPINLLFSQVVKIGGQPISFQIGPRYYATTVDQGARWGVRFNVTLLFPAK